MNGKFLLNLVFCLCHMLSCLWAHRGTVDSGVAVSAQPTDTVEYCYSCCSEDTFPLLSVVTSAVCVQLPWSSIDFRFCLRVIRIDVVNAHCRCVDGRGEVATDTDVTGNRWFHSSESSPLQLMSSLSVSTQQQPCRRRRNSPTLRRTWSVILNKIIIIINNNTVSWYNNNIVFMYE